ncbi:zinc uptake protein ZrgA [Grimontia hollisae]|uniref:zinc uptake protein ZrgA n=1 Tax=Grimontia hollisae TaxID=673 RepID=UPI0013035B4C|nr:DUF2796 domain-containing protein [Grimontia hollisae]
MLSKNMFALSAIALGIASTASADHDEHRQHDAHQHGVVEWHIAQDGDELLAEITAPGSDVVGFEHAPENAAQKAAIEKAMTTLAKPGALFAINAEAGCELESHTVSNTLGKGNGDHHDHDHHAHEEGHHDEHDDHEHHEEHAHHDDHHDHDHDDHDKKMLHGEFSAQYTFHCQSPDSLKTVSTNWFEVFGNTEKISVQAITDKGVVAGKLVPASNTFRF